MWLAPKFRSSARGRWNQGPWRSLSRALGGRNQWTDLVSIRGCFCWPSGSSSVHCLWGIFSHCRSLGPGPVASRCHGAVSAVTGHTGKKAKRSQTRPWATPAEATSAYEAVSHERLLGIRPSAGERAEVLPNPGHAPREKRGQKGSIRNWFYAPASLLP